MLSLGKQLPLLGGMALIYFAAGAYCGLRMTATDRDQGLRFLLLAFVIAVPLSLWQIKLLPYATFLPIPLIAASLGRPPKERAGAAHAQRYRTHRPHHAGGSGVGGWLVLVVAAPSSNRVKETLKPVQDCQSTAAVAPLAELPKGLAVADVNLGPYIVALTDLDVLSAPYHRLDKSIIEAHEILHGAPADAEKRLRSVGARYVVTCAGLDLTTVQGKPNADALQTLLFAAKPPAFLSPVPLPAKTPLKVWRVVDN